MAILSIEGTFGFFLSCDHTSVTSSASTDIDVFSVGPFVTRQVCADESGSLLQWSMGVEAVSFSVSCLLYYPG